jgi:signal transduction histidine kinase
MNSQRPSIRIFLRVWIFGFALAALLLSTALFIKYSNDEIDRDLLQARNLIQLYADDTVSIEYGRRNLVYVADSLRRLNQLLNGTKTRIRANDGSVVESTVPSEIGTKAAPTDRYLQTLNATVREHSSGEVLGTLEVVIDRKSLIAGALEKALLPALILLFSLMLLSIFTIRSLQRRVIRPIKQLLSTREVPTKESALWPTEIYDLSVRLQNALKQRDLAMIGQFSSGIVHDLKTSLHSLRTGIDLTQDSELNSPSRVQRLELLM